ncbi:hypothetical protein BRD56_05835 [Thermoplasmatales archaeon SW_10_69_26]|nr:MAG: hypothetical protein BRD56_05835 [Thermoplasmatales archaeon SW_10_69_26]
MAAGGPPVIAKHSDDGSEPDRGLDAGPAASADRHTSAGDRCTGAVAASAIVNGKTRDVAGPGPVEAHRLDGRGCTSGLAVRWGPRDARRLGPGRVPAGDPIV